MGVEEGKKKIHYVQWDQMCNYKAYEGISMIDLEVKYCALLNKWLWRYGREKDSLWREMPVEKTRSDLSKLFPNTSVNRRMSTL